MSKFNIGDEVTCNQFTEDVGKTFEVYDADADSDGDIKIKPISSSNTLGWRFRGEAHCTLVAPEPSPAPAVSPATPPPVPAGTPPEIIEAASTVLSIENQEANMAKTTRNLVRVVLIDQDAGLDVAKSLVKDFGTFVSEGSESELINEILMDTKHNVESVLRGHNAARAKEVDLDILQRTGNEVKLREVKLKDLTWKVTAA